jgi:hypothetical protein
LYITCYTTIIVYHLLHHHYCISPVTPPLLYITCFTTIIVYYLLHHHVCLIPVIQSYMHFTCYTSIFAYNYLYNYVRGMYITYCFTIFFIRPIITVWMLITALGRCNTLALIWTEFLALRTNLCKTIVYFRYNIVSLCDPCIYLNIITVIPSEVFFNSTII